MSNRILQTGSASAVQLVAAKGSAFAGESPTALDLAVVPASWGNNDIGIVPEFDLNVWGAAALDLTALELLAMIPRLGAVANDAVDLVDFANNELDLTSHAYKTGDGPFTLTTAGTLPTGLELLTHYWIIYVNSGSIKLATSRANALAGTAVTFSDAGASTHTIVDVDGVTELMYAHSVGLLGHAQNGLVSLTARKAYTARVKHDPRALAYSLAGGISTSTASAEIVPVQER
jgi:hypothetical protein